MNNRVDAAGSVVDVVAVCNIVKMQQLPYEADGGTSKRDNMLMVRVVFGGEGEGGAQSCMSSNKQGSQDTDCIVEKEKASYP